MTTRRVGRAPALDRAPTPVGTVVVDGSPVEWDHLLRYVVDVRAHADSLEAAAVEAGRAAGASWDRLSLVMGGSPSGEQLRRRHAARLAEGG